VTGTQGTVADAPDFTEPAPPSDPPGASVLGEVSGVIGSARRVVSGMLDLVVLEGRRAGIALALMIGLGLAAAILAITAWMGVMAAVALGLMAAGVSPILSILIVVVLNLAGAGGAVFACMKKSKDLLFPATRRQVARKTAELPASA
jgi:uncharacterized membrane protein YqjE